MKALLLPCLYWNCPACGKEQFIKLEVSEMPNSRDQAFDDDNYVLTEEEGMFNVECPDIATCQNCLRKFEIEFYNETSE